MKLEEAFGSNCFHYELFTDVEKIIRNTVIV